MRSKVRSLKFKFKLQLTETLQARGLNFSSLKCELGNYIIRLTFKNHPTNHGKYLNVYENNLGA